MNAIDWNGFRFPRQTGGIRLGQIFALGAIIGAVVFVDWGAALEKLSFDSMGPASAALTRLECELEGTRLDTYAVTSGSVKNISGEPLPLSVRVDYASGGRIFAGKRTIERVRPSPLEPDATGTFSLREHVEFPPIEIGCLIQFYENDINQPVAFEDRT